MKKMHLREEVRLCLKNHQKDVTSVPIEYTKSLTFSTKQYATHVEKPETTKHRFEKKQREDYKNMHINNMDFFVVSEGGGCGEFNDLRRLTKSEIIDLVKFAESRYTRLKKMQFKREIWGDCDLSFRQHTNPVCDFCGQNNFGEDIDDRKMFKLWGYGGSVIGCDDCLNGFYIYDENVLAQNENYDPLTDPRLLRKKWIEKGSPQKIPCFHNTR